MTGGGRSPLLLVISLCSFGRASATLTEPEICYILDGILFMYGIILTALYCRIKVIRMYNARAATAENTKGKQTGDESIYQGLTPHAKDTYETIAMKKSHK